MGSISQPEVPDQPILRKTSLTTYAAQRLRQISAGKFDKEVREKASLCLIDFLGAAQSGLLGPLSQSMAEYTILRAGSPESYVFGEDKAFCAETAAFVNTVLAHSAARDDMHLESCSHMGGIVVSAVLALAQRDHWSGEQMLRGIVGGYEMGALLGTAIRAGGSINTCLRPSGMIGAFTVAAAAVAATYVDEESAVNALSLAVNMACGVNEWAWSGGQELFIQNGTASRAGITAYDLARCGIKSSSTVLEGKYGFFAAVNAGIGAPDVFQNWIDSSEIGRGILDVRFKPAPTCNFTQTSSAIALTLGSTHHLKMHDVEAINITTTTAAISYPGCDSIGPLRTASQGKMSIQYGVCAALAFKRLDEQSLARINDEEVNVLMKKCTLFTDAGYEKAYKEGRQPAKVEVQLKDGAVLQEEARDVPWFDEAQVTARFLREMAALLPEDKAKSLLDRCRDLGSVKYFEIV